MTHSTCAPSFVAQVGPPYPDESLLGYVTRAISVTTVDHLPTALRVAGAATPKPLSIATTLESGEIARLSHLLGCEPEDIASRTYRGGERLPQYRSNFELIDFFGTAIRPRLRETRFRRVSPRALEKAPYHRAVWELRPFSFDPDTKETLLSNCPACGQPLGWLQALGPTVCDKCTDADRMPTVDLRDFRQPLVEVADEEALDFATGLVAPDSAKKAAARALLPDEFRDLSNGEIFETVMALGYGLAGHGPDRRWFGREHLYRMTPELLCLAARAVIGGQNGFDALCERYRSTSGRKAGRHGRMKELGRLAWLSNSETTVHPKMQLAFRQMIEKNFSKAIASELGIPIATDDFSPPIVGMASQLGVRPEKLRHLSLSGLVPVVRAAQGKLPVRMALRDVAPLVDDMKDALRPRDAARMIGASVYAVRDLAEHGMIERAEAPIAAMLVTADAYSKSSIERLIERLKVAVRNRTTGERITLACSRIRAGTTPWAAIVSSILEDSSNVVLDPRAEDMKLRNLMTTDPRAFVTAVRGHMIAEEIPDDPDEEWIGPAEAAELLKITYAAFWRLARARPNLIKPQRRGGTPYRLAGILEVSKLYMFVGEIALRRGLHPRLAVASLKSTGIKPAFSIRKKQDLVYFRKDVERWLELLRLGTVARTTFTPDLSR